MKKYFILLKEHKITGLKYLCFHFGTRENCYTYKGSGLYWTRHLSKHGKSISTVILKEAETREALVDVGLYYSKLWDVVNSKEYANLTVECCQTTAEPLSRPDVRAKRDKAYQKRITENPTDKEIARLKKMQKAAQAPEVRARAAATLRDRLACGEFTEKELARGEKRKQRIKVKGFTDKELAYHKRVADNQKGKTMKDRCGEDYIDPRKGKKRLTPNSTKGKTAKEIHGESYIDPRSKKFSINGEIFESERDCITKTQLSAPILTKLKKEGTYIVKKIKSSKNKYEDKETLTLKFL